MSDIDAAQLRKLDFSLLLVLDGAVRHRKLSTVAERLNLTQSAVSHALSRLREIFADPLFVRRPHGVEPTARALELAGPVAAILSLAGEALKGPAPFDPTRARRTFRIAAPDQETALLAPALLRAAAGTNVNFSFRVRLRDAALRGLAENELDLALGFFWRTPEGVETEKLYDERYALVLREGHRALKGKLTPARFAALDHVLVSPGGDVRGIVDERLEALGLTRRVVLAVPYFFAALSAVAEGDAVATVPYRLAQRYAARFGLATRAPPIEVRSFPVHSAWSARAQTDAGLQWLRDAVRRAADDHARAVAR